jgi:hypothetical protein
MTAAVAAAKNNKILLKKNKEKQQDTDRCSICGKKLRLAATAVVRRVIAVTHEIAFSVLSVGTRGTYPPRCMRYFAIINCNRFDCARSNYNFSPFGSIDYFSCFFI